MSLQLNMVTLQFLLMRCIEKESETFGEPIGSEKYLPKQQTNKTNKKQTNKQNYFVQVL